LLFLLWKVVDWRGDNAGPPPTAASLISDFEALQKEFPGAQIVPSTFDKFVAAIADIPDEDFPTLTSEIGDTWIHGIASDPLKLAKIRIMQYEASICLKAKKCEISDPNFWNFYRFFLKNAEHTWGLDNKSTLKHYIKSKWSNQDLVEIVKSSEGNSFLASFFLRAWKIFVMRDTSAKKLLLKNVTSPRSEDHPILE
jgi:hypothetical protein